MKIITVEKEIDGFNQLIESKQNGEYAVWKLGACIHTTDDIPKEFENMELFDIVNEMKRKAIARSGVLKIIPEEDKNGYNQLIELDNNGDYAVWENNDTIYTTDDIPAELEKLDFPEIIYLMKENATLRKQELEEIKNKRVK